MYIVPKIRNRLLKQTWYRAYVAQENAFMLFRLYFGPNVKECQLHSRHIFIVREIKFNCHHGPHTQQFCNATLWACRKKKEPTDNQEFVDWTNHPHSHVHACTQTHTHNQPTNQPPTYTIDDYIWNFDQTWNTICT